MSERYRQQLAAERTVRRDFLGAWWYRASLSDVYEAVKDSNIVDHIEQDYLSRGWLSGMRVPPPPAPETGEADARGLRPEYGATPATPAQAGRVSFTAVDTRAKSIAGLHPDQ